MIVHRVEAFNNGNIPNAEGMLTVAENILATGSKYPFIGGAILGSYPRLRLTSDIDVVVLCESKARDLAHQYRQQIFDLAKLLHVNIEDFLVLTTDEALGCAHTIHPGYFKHIKWCIEKKKTGFGCDILPYIRPYPSDLEAARSYFAHKRRLLDNLKLHHKAAFSPEWYKLIEEILNTLFYLLLRLAEAEGYTGGGSKKQIIEMAAEYVPCHLSPGGEEILPLLKHINKLRQRIVELTEGIAAHNASIESYTAALYRIADQVGPVDRAYRIIGQRIDHLVAAQAATTV